MVNRSLMKPIGLLIVFVLVLAAAVPLPSRECRSCTAGACNITLDDAIGNDAALQANRTKRESSIEYRSCNQVEMHFQLEIVFIPLAIAMIPVGLLALLLCVFCCGPKESRGKIPEKFSSKKKSVEKSDSDVDGIELVCKDGIVMRKDSSKTRFSTAIYFIESRRVSIDILNDTGSMMATQQTVVKTENDDLKLPTIMDEESTQQSSEEQSEDRTEKNKDENLPRRITSKKTRFSDDVAILGETVLNPQKLALKGQA